MKNLNELPDKWENEMYENFVEKRAIAFQSLQKLLILRDIYRDGWLPNDYRYEWKIGFMNGVFCEYFDKKYVIDKGGKIRSLCVLD